MKSKNVKIFVLASIGLLSSCAQKQTEISITDSNESLVHKQHTVKEKQHNFGGWYCPDNLYGFPAVDLTSWNEVPTINNRMPSIEEAKSEASLIYVDPKEHPNAVVLPITMPRLATYYSKITHREEIIIAIQAFKVNQDSIVGFRFLNGGNGSAWLSEINFKTNEEIAAMPSYQFVTDKIEINAKPEAIWNVITGKANAEELRKVFDPNGVLNNEWRSKTNVNFSYENAGEPTAWYADILFGCYYVQNDYEKNNFTEKFF